MQNLSTKKALGSNGFLSEFEQYPWRNTAILHNLFHKIKKDRNTSQLILLDGHYQNLANKSQEKKPTTDWWLW